MNELVVFLIGLITGPVVSLSLIGRNKRSQIWYDFLDSYDHYRSKVGLGRIHSLYRALYYEIKHKEPWA